MWHSFLEIEKIKEKKKWENRDVSTLFLTISQ